jgi:hypothetical protein
MHPKGASTIKAVRSLTLVCHIAPLARAAVGRQSKSRIINWKSLSTIGFQRNILLTAVGVEGLILESQGLLFAFFLDYASATHYLLATHIALVLSNPTPRPGMLLDDHADYPTLTLPYGTWRAIEYNCLTDILHFKTMRLAAFPVGDLRCAKRGTNRALQGIEAESSGRQCIQATSLSFKPPPKPCQWSWWCPRQHSIILG